MMRSLYAGVSGLQNHQTRMDVIGNNVANVNTTGFKKGRVIFQDMISQGLRGAARPTEELGGVNPMQVGLGMSVATIDTIHTQGSLQTTGNLTDVAIQGEGFFILREGGNELYTRSGAFGLDANGSLVNPANGMRVQGWTSEIIDGEAITNTAADVQDITIPVGGKDLPQATTLVEMACNLNANTPEIPDGATDGEIRAGTWSVNKEIYDAQGNLHILAMTFTKTQGVNNQWDVNVTVDGEDGNTTIDIGGGDNGTANFTVSFDNNGTLLSAVDPQGDTVNAGQLQVAVAFDVLGSTPDPDTGVLDRQVFNLNLGEVGSAYNTITQTGDTSSTKAFRQNGYTLGYLETFEINSRGMITGVYSNGNKRSIAQLDLASFVNPGGLEKGGDTTFVETINSGEPNIGPSGIAGKGSFIAGALEMSNVDLAGEFTDMIITQRGFQANSKTITTSDTMLQELLQLKR